MKTVLPSVSPNLSSYLEDLQEGTVKVTAIFIGALGYIWVFYSFWAVYIDHYRQIPLTSWCGGWVLTLGAIISYVIGSKHLLINAYFLSACILAASICGVLALAMPSLLYLLVMPVIFAGVLLGQMGLAATALIVTLLAFRLSSTLASSNTFLTIGAIVLVTFATWLSQRNLRTALTWTWQGYERAHENQETARDRAGELQRTLKALDEATYRLERANYMLALARDQAEEARSLKQQFAQTISHELRTPLNLIVGFTELMAEESDYYGVDLSPTYLRDLDIVYRNARHLQNLVNDVLDLARIEAAQMSIVPAKTSPANLVEEALETTRGLVEAQGLALYADIEPHLPALWVDPVRIRQVLLNLINNAVRFTDKGSITVRAHQRGQEIVFAVSDTGIGIAPQDQKRIFEEFRQADGSTKRSHEGAGLGLAISKQFVELHKGRIWLQSEAGQGSTFYFSLPIREHRWDDSFDAQLTQAPAKKDLQAPSGEEPILLLVTRSLSAATLLTRHIHGCYIVATSNLVEAQDIARRIIPQVVVVDRMSESIDEHKVAALARDWNMHATSFIAVPLPGEEPLLRRLSVEGYLIKPVSRDSLWNTMRQFGETVDRILIVDDDRDFVRLMSRLLEDNLLRPYQVIGAYNGQQALARIRNEQPDLVLLDLGLPDIDGLQIIEQVKSDANLQDIPIVIVSAQESVDYQNPLPGTAIATKAVGLMPDDVVHWIQSIVDAC